MNVLIVHAHPEPQSFNAAMAQTASHTLTEQGHAVQWSDLYAMRFNPVASGADFLEPKDPVYMNYALEQRHASTTHTLAADIQSELDKLMWADLLLMVFPVYWCSAPAILKGWIDRVLVSGICYGGKRFYDKGGLAGKQAMLGVTIGAQAHMFAEEGIHGDLNTMLRPILQGSLAYVGISVLEPFVAYHVPYINPQAREDIMQDWIAALQTLDQRLVLPMPRLADFDERLYRLATPQASSGS